MYLAEDSIFGCNEFAGAFYRIKCKQKNCSVENKTSTFIVSVVL